MSVANPVRADFTFAADPGNPLTINFSNASSGDITTYAWDFNGDGVTDSGDVNPSFTYPAGGSYVVTLTVSGPGGTNAASQTVSVAFPVTAFFTWSASSSDPLTVNFTNGSSGDNITGYAWDFNGDGVTDSGEINPSFTYPAGGSYVVSLTTSSATSPANTYSETITVQTPVQPAQALFTPMVLDPVNDPLTVQFTNDSTGDITGYLWDFGDGSQSGDFAPTHTYAQGGTYPVTLIVFGADGVNANYSLNVTVQSPVQPPSAYFTWQADAGDPLSVQFTDESTGDFNLYLWDFGDSSQSSEADPFHTFASGGDYTVTLTVTNSDNGQSDTYSETVTVTVAQTEPSTLTIVDSTPIQPDVTSQALAPTIGNIVNFAVQSGNQMYVFGFAGDDIVAASSQVLDPFAPGSFASVTDPDLQTTIDAFNSTDLGGVTAFNWGSAAVRSGATAAQLLDPNFADASVCPPGQSPIDCELSRLRPSIFFINVGYFDALYGTDVNAFRGQLQQIVDSVRIANALPVLVTIAPRTDGAISAAQIQAINEQIIDVANVNNLPLLNLWRLLNELPSSGLGADGVNLSVSPTGAGDLSEGATSNYGANAVNEALLMLLNDLRVRYLP